MVDVPENTSTSFPPSRFSPNPDTLVSQADRVLVHPDFRRVPLDQDSDRVSVDHPSGPPVSVHQESNRVHVNLDSHHAPVYPEESARDAGIDASLIVSQSSQFQEIMSLINSNKNQSSSLLLLQGTVTDHPARILLDCGASHNFVAANFVGIHQLTTSNIPRVVVSVANGMESPIDRELKDFPLRIAEFVDTVSSAYVFDIPSSSDYDLILGLPWLFTNNPRIDWKRRTITICKNNPPVVLHSVPLSSLETFCSSADLETSLHLLNAKQLTRCQQVYLITAKMLDFLPSTTSSPVGQPLQSVLRQFSDVFPDDLHQLPPIRDIDHEIKLLDDTSPPVQQPYRMSPLELRELKHQLEQLLSKGFIRPSNSPYGAPVLFAKKKDGSLRMCVDYRALNKITIKNKYPIPRVDELLDQLSGATIFSRIDLKSGYHQIRINEEDVEKSAFRTRYGSFEFLVLPFGMTNAPPTFMRLMNSVFHQYLDEFVILYLDDILIYSRSEEEHLHHVRLVLQLLRRNQFFANRDKCEFGVDRIEFIGHIVTPQGIQVDERKVLAVKNWPVLKSSTDVRSFLGAVGFYRRFIPQFSQIATPLTDLTRTFSRFHWTHQHQHAFVTLKEALMTAPVLRLPDFQLPFIVVTDASSVAIGGVLMQADDLGERPIAFESRKLNDAESRYPVHEQELFAIIVCLRTWRCYLEGMDFIIRTDHRSLEHLPTQKHMSRRMVRWVEFLQHFNFRIEYKPGKENVVSDALSRLNTINLHATTDEHVQDWPLSVRDYLQHSTIDSTLPEHVAELIKRESPSFVYDESTETLYRKISDHELAPYVPFISRFDLVLKFHTAYGHLGAAGIKELLRTRGWWPQMARDITRWLQQCVQCQLATGHKVPIEPLHPLTPVPAFHRWSLDFIGQLPITSRGNQWILLAIDHTTKWPIARATPTATHDVVAKFVYEMIVLNFGCPSEIITDRGNHFTADLLTSYFRLIGVKHVLTSAYHPRSNGVLERFNRLFNNMLAKYVGTNDVHTWDQYVDRAVFACRIRQHTATGQSPFYMVYGIQPKIPGDELVPLVDDDDATTANVREQQLNQLAQQRDVVVTRLTQNMTTMKNYYDRNIHQHSVRLQENDWVLLYTENKKKFQPHWNGPFKIRKICPLGTFQLEDIYGHVKPDLVHRDHLKKAHLDSAPDSIWYKPQRRKRR